jgi:two-component system sensor histidine kinase TctE
MLMGELIGNLVANAIAYAGRGAEATVAVTSTAETVMLSVADTGAGVPADKVAHLGQRFSRQHGDKPGEGLGLAIVREIAALCGGHAEIRSDRGLRRLRPGDVSGPATGG